MSPSHLAFRAPAEPDTPPPVALEPAYPAPAAKVRLGGEPGRFLGALWIDLPGRGRMDLEVAWTRKTNTLLITLDGASVGRGLWRNWKIADVSIFGLGAPTPSDLEGALHEIEQALIAGADDPDLLVAAEDVVPYEGLGTIDERLERGVANEERGIALVRAAVEGLTWVAQVRKATLKEDRRGIDVIVETVDAGDLYVQVKSSELGAKTWTGKYGRKPIFDRSVLVIFEPGHPSTKLASVTEALSRLHLKFAGQSGIVPSLRGHSPVARAEPEPDPSVGDALRIVTFPSTPTVLLIQAEQGSTATVQLPPLEPPFTRYRVAKACEEAGLSAFVVDVTPGHYSPAIKQARAVEKAQLQARSRAARMLQAALLKNGPALAALAKHEFLTRFYEAAQTTLDAETFARLGVLAGKTD